MIYKKITSVIALLAFISGVFSPLSIAVAAPLTSQSDIMSRLRTSTLSNHTIKFVTPTGVTAGQTITLTFPGAFTMGTFAVNNVDFATGASCSSISSERTLAASPSGTTWGVAQSGQVITITSGTDTVTAGHCIEIEIGSNATSGGAGTTQITNPASASTYAISFAAGSGADTGSATVAIITDDQVVITATVDQALSFAISDNTIGFGTLGSGAARYANGAGTGSASETEAHTLTASTNASSGYIITVNGNTLTSGANTIDAIGGTNTASSAGTEQFGIRATATGGSGTVTAPYAAAGFAFTAGSPTQIASATGSSATTTYSMRYLANISGATEAGSYTATHTYVATTTF